MALPAEETPAWSGDDLPDTGSELAQVHLLRAGGRHTAGRLPLPAPIPPVRPRVVVDGLPLDPVTEEEASRYVLDSLDAGVGGQIITASVDILRQLRRPSAAGIAAAASLIVADGMPLVWASRLLGTPVPMRVAGSSLVRTLARDAEAHGRSLFLLGGPPGSAEQAAINLLTDHPRLQVVGTSCPDFGFENDSARWREVVDALDAARPDIVFVALGALKQERVGIRLRELFPQTWFLGCGGSLSFLADFLPRAPERWQRMGLEWLYRLAQEPRRLWHRYLVEDAPAALAMFLRALRARLRRR